MSSLELRGCQPRPLLSYLKALGVFRLVGEQADDAAARWTPPGLELHTRLRREGLESFLLEDYVPTPIVAPWNGRSGLFQDRKRLRPSEKRVNRVLELDVERIAPLQQALRVGFELHRIAEERGWDRRRDKDRWVSFYRNRAPEKAVEWIDAIAVLAEEDPVYPIAFGGSGGNFGSMDLGDNWLQHLTRVLPLEEDHDAAASREWLSAALWQETSVPAVEGAVNQFDPGHAGGENLARRHTGGGSWVNPWDFVLALEGAPLLASGVARRSGSQGGRRVAAMPFTVYSSGIGHSDAAAEESADGELWLPLWGRAASLEEVRRLFAEARAQWDGRQARTGLDFVQAIASLGADRGIDAFQRFDIVERLGQSSLAVPAGRIRVQERSEAGLLAPIDRWVARVARAAELPAAVEQGVRAVRAAQFDVAANGGAERLWDLLGALAGLQRRVSRSGSTRGRVHPIGGLDPARWIPLLQVEGEEEELSVAIGLASVHDAVESSARGDAEPHTLAGYLLPLAGGDRNRAWTGRPPLVEGFRTRPLPAVLAEVLVRRSMKEQDRQSDDVRIALLGVEPWFTFGRHVQAEVAEAFAAGRLDTGRIEQMLDALLLLGWEWDDAPPGSGTARGQDTPVSVAPIWRLLAPFFSPRAIYGRGSRLDAGAGLRLRPTPQWASQLSVGDLEGVAGSALQRLRVAGLDPLPGDARVLAVGADGPRTAGALLLGIPSGQVRSLLESTTANLAEVLGETVKEPA